MNNVSPQMLADTLEAVGVHVEPEAIKRLWSKEDRAAAMAWATAVAKKADDPSVVIPAKPSCIK